MYLLFILFWCGYMRSFIHLVFQAFVSKQSTQRRWWWWWRWGRLFQPPKQRGGLSLEVKGRIINFQQATWKQQTCEVVLCVSGPTCVSPRCRRCTRSGFWSSAGRGRCCLCVGQTDKYIIFYFFQTDPLSTSCSDVVRLTVLFVSPSLGCTRVCGQTCFSCRGCGFTFS